MIVFLNLGKLLSSVILIRILREEASLSSLAESTDIPPYVMKCPSNGLCSRLPADCIDCKTNFSCVYGKPVTFDCTVKPSVTCVVSTATYEFLINSL